MLKLISCISLFKIQEDVNIIAVDWQQGAIGPDYLTAVHNVSPCGLKISIFSLKNKINPELSHCIGHSLGNNKKN